MIDHRDVIRSILVIEDSAEDYEAVARAFKKTGAEFKIFWCQSGSDALEFLKNQRPSIILLDLNMPGLDGLETLQLIKENADLKAIPVIMLTTSSSDRDIRSSYQMGASTYVQKPLSFDGLIRTIQGIKNYWFDDIALLAEGA